MQVITYFFYKNLTFTLTQFWFTFQTGFSGQRFYDDWNQSLYNVIFTALPVIIVGLFDKVWLLLVVYEFISRLLPEIVLNQLISGRECFTVEKIPTALQGRNQEFILQVESDCGVGFLCLLSVNSVLLLHCSCEPARPWFIWQDSWPMGC